MLGNANSRIKGYETILWDDMNWCAQVWYVWHLVSHLFSRWCHPRLIHQGQVFDFRKWVLQLLLLKWAMVKTGLVRLYAGLSWKRLIVNCFSVLGHLPRNNVSHIKCKWLVLERIPEITDFTSLKNLRLSNGLFRAHLHKEFPDTRIIFPRTGTKELDQQTCSLTDLVTCRICAWWVNSMHVTCSMAARPTEQAQQEISRSTA